MNRRPDPASGFPLAASDDRRTLALWCPDWPFVAAGLDPATQPAVILRAGRIAACSYAARVEGVARGMRRRDAERRAPDLVVLPDDPGGAVRAFEPVVEAIAELVPSVEVVRPGLCSIAIRRAARYFGGESRAAHRLASTVQNRTGVDVQIGIADGLFAATLAAQQGVGIVPAAQTAAFLAPQRIGLLDRPAFTGLLTRLGIHTLGDLAALPAADVHDRFGAEGEWAHRLAGGRQQQVRTSRRAPLDLIVEQVLDPPVDRVDAAAFVARTLAQTMQERLNAHGLSCLGLTIEAVTAHEQLLERRWRHDGTLNVAGIADRVRWQLDGWLNGASAGSADGRPRSGIALLRLIPEQIVSADGRQLDLVRNGHEPDPEQEARVDRALTRIQGLLGHPAVVTAVIEGGHDPLERVRWVPWTDPRDEPDAASARVLPWPGQLPDPPPATVLRDRPELHVEDAHGRTVSVSGRSSLSAAPARIRFARDATSASGHRADDNEPRTIVAWAGPWAADTRWWDPLLSRRRARFQLLCDTGEALLVVREGGRWRLEARYD